MSRLGIIKRLSADERVREAMLSGFAATGLHELAVLCEFLDELGCVIPGPKAIQVASALLGGNMAAVRDLINSGLAKQSHECFDCTVLCAIAKVATFRTVGPYRWGKAEDGEGIEARPVAQALRDHSDDVHCIFTQSVDGAAELVLYSDFAHDPVIPVQNIAEAERLLEGIEMAAMQRLEIGPFTPEPSEDELREAREDAEGELKGDIERDLGGIPG